MTTSTKRWWAITNSGNASGEKGGIFDVVSADPVTSRKKMSRHVAIAHCYKYEKSH